MPSFTDLESKSVYLL